MSSSQAKKQTLKNVGVVFGSACALVLAALAFAQREGVLRKPYPWDDIDYIFHAFVAATEILSARNITELFSVFSGITIHSLSSLVSTLAFMLSGEPKFALFLVSMLSVIPVLAATYFSRAPALIPILVLLLTPLFFAASSTFKIDYAGGLAFGALLYMLFVSVRTPVFTRVELTLFSIVGVICLTSKMTNLINPAFYAFLCGMFLLTRWIFTSSEMLSLVGGWRARDVIQNLHLSFNQDRRLIISIVIVPFVFYVCIVAWQFDSLLAYVWSVIRPDSIWLDPTPIHQRLTTTFMANWSRVDFLPALGSFHAAGSVSIGIAVSVLALVRIKEDWPIMLFAMIGMLYILFVAWISPAANPSFAGPGYGIMHFAAFYYVVQKYKARRARGLGIAVMIMISLFFVSLTHNAWHRGTGIDGKVYADFIKAVAVAVEGNRSPRVVVTADFARMPHPNISYELIRMGRVSRWIWTSRIDTMDDIPTIHEADALVVVRTKDLSICGFIPSCEISKEIAEIVLQRVDVDHIGTFDMGAAEISVFSVKRSESPIVKNSGEKNDPTPSEN